MAATVIEISAHEQACGRVMYEETDTPVQAIAEFFGISRTTLLKRIKQWGWKRRRGRVPAGTQGPAPGSMPPVDLPALARADLLAGVMRSVQHELAAIEASLAKLKRSKDAAQAERMARTLASLARTVREVMRMEAPPPAAAAESAEDNEPPYDVEELRRDLLARLARFAAEQEGCVSGDAEEPGRGGAADDVGPVRP